MHFHKKFLVTVINNYSTDTSIKNDADNMAVLEALLESFSLAKKYFDICYTQ